MEIPLIYLKDKQAWKKEQGVMKILGKAVDVCKDLAREHKLVHIIDLDGQRGMNTNLDVYDTLTYFIHVQVEGFSSEKIIDKLVAYDVRIVIPLPCTYSLKHWKEKKKFLVGMVDQDIRIPEEIGDLIVKDLTVLEKLKKQDPKRRYIWAGPGKVRGVFGTITT